jgi:hypothetical protein
MSRAILKDYRRLNRPESGLLLKNFRLALAILIAIKIWPFFPLYLAPSQLVAAMTFVAALAAAALLFDFYARVACFYLLLFFISACVERPSEFSEYGLSGHNNVHLLCLCILGFLFMRKKGATLAFGIGFRFLRFLTICVYLGAILTKLNSFDLTGLHFQQIFYRFYWGSDPIAWSGFAFLMQGFAIGTIAVEAAILAGLMYMRTRKAAVGIGIAFHSILFLALPVSIFSGLMILLLCLFWPRSSDLGRLTTPDFIPIQ